MGGGGSAAAMNTVINNNRKLLKRKAREKMAYTGIITNENHNGYTFDDKTYSVKEKRAVLDLLAKRKKEVFIANRLGLILTLLFIGLFVLYFIFWVRLKTFLSYFYC